MERSIKYASIISPATSLTVWRRVKTSFLTMSAHALDMPLFRAPTALQRLFHHDGERAVAKAAGTMFRPPMCDAKPVA
jgi:isopentenyl diphosphate isomerase/L-lactate dehydrogenase-like FMN-dependent dehydrogenase